MASKKNVFISYSSIDNEFASRLKQSLIRRGITVWLDQDEIRPGDLFAKALEDGIHDSNTVALIVSSHAMKSGWVEAEYYRALSLSTEKRTQLIPIILENVPLPGFLKDRNWVDFKDENLYDKNIDKLIWGITGKKRDNRSTSSRQKVIDQNNNFPNISQPHSKNIPFLAPTYPLFNIIGRKRLINDVKRRIFLDENPQVTAFYGIPGVGKTSLLLVLAHDKDILGRFCDGVLWVGLGREPDLPSSLVRWAKAVGVSSDEMSTLQTNESLIKAIHDAIGMRKMLLIIDDAWNLPDALSFKVGGPYCYHLLTTRNPEIAVNFSGGSAIPLKELEAKDSLNLLKEVCPNLIQENLLVANNLVKAVGGLPLALILAGNYLRTELLSNTPENLQYSATKLYDTEGQQIEFYQSPLEKTPFSRDELKLSLSSVIGTSYDSLEYDVQQYLQLLSLFPPKPNTFSLEMALSLCNENDANNSIKSLVKIGLLEVFGGGQYTLHQTIADFVKLRITQKEDNAITFAKKVLAFLIKHKNNFKYLDDELNNAFEALNLAYSFKQEKLFLEGLDALFPFWEIRGLYNTARGYLEKAQPLGYATEEQNILKKNLLYLGRAASSQGDYGAAQNYWTEALELPQPQDNLGMEMTCKLLCNLGAISGDQGEYEKSEKYYLLALEMAEKIKNKEMLLEIYKGKGKLAIRNGMFSLAKQYDLQALSIAEEIQDGREISTLQHNLGWVAFNLGNYEQAHDHFLTGLEVAKALKYQEGISSILLGLGMLAYSQGEILTSEQHYKDGLEIAYRIGHSKEIVRLETGYGQVKYLLGEYQAAEDAYQRGLLLAKKIDHKARVSYLLANLAELNIKLQNLEKSERLLEEALEIVKIIGHQRLISYILLLFGELRIADNNAEEARKSFRGALDIAKKISQSEYSGLALFGLARAFYLLGDKGEALKLSDEALKILQGISNSSVERIRIWKKETL